MFTTLIVDENLTFRQSLKEMLRDRCPAMNVKEATRGDKALRMINAEVPDLIFMDIRLPDGNGLKITRKIKRRNCQVPIIILASYDFEEYRKAAYQCGADFFIAKGSSMWSETMTLLEAVYCKAATRIGDVPSDDA